MNIDTNILIAYVLGEKIVVDFIEDLKNKNVKLFISSLVEAELISQKDLTEKDLSLLYEFISNYFIVIPVDRYTLVTASEIRRKYSK